MPSNHSLHISGDTFRASDWLARIEEKMTPPDPSKPARPLSDVELQQRQKLAARLADRPRPTREQFEEAGVPALNEEPASPQSPTRKLWFEAENGTQTHIDVPIGVVSALEYWVDRAKEVESRLSTVVEGLRPKLDEIEREFCRCGAELDRNKPKTWEWCSIHDKCDAIREQFPQEPNP